MTRRAAVIGYRKLVSSTQPAYAHEPYRSTHRCAPGQPLIAIPASLSEVTGPSFDRVALGPDAGDLSAGHGAEALGERIIVSGRVLDENGRPVPQVLIELWQANAAGRYLHGDDQHDAPIDPSFTGVGQLLTDQAGRYRFKTIKPGAYPWRHHHNAWRPQHIHFSLLGPALGTRLVTQMYFPGDPLLAFDPIINSVPDADARARLVCRLDWEVTQSEYALGYCFDLILRGRKQTPWEP
jgi:protocatechuate 3,4-dioxygenase beta subunit